MTPAVAIATLIRPISFIRMMVDDMLFVVDRWVVELGKEIPARLFGCDVAWCLIRHHESFQLQMLAGQIGVPY